jgi:hypothetical protein
VDVDRFLTDFVEDAVHATNHLSVLPHRQCIQLGVKESGPKWGPTQAGAKDRAISAWMATVFGRRNGNDIAIDASSPLNSGTKPWAKRFAPTLARSHAVSWAENARRA